MNKPKIGLEDSFTPSGDVIEALSRWGIIGTLTTRYEDGSWRFGFHTDKLISQRVGFGYEQTLSTVERVLPGMSVSVLYVNDQGRPRKLWTPRDDLQPYDPKKYVKLIISSSTEKP